MIDLNRHWYTTQNGNECLKTVNGKLVWVRIQACTDGPHGPTGPKLIKYEVMDSDEAGKAKAEEEYIEALRAAMADLPLFPP
jgi:hypothetical protein